MEDENNNVKVKVMQSSNEKIIWVICKQYTTDSEQINKVCLVEQYQLHNIKSLPKKI